MIWCEHCRSHYEEDHYASGDHKIGIGYGPVGRSLALENAAQALVKDQVGSASWYEAYRIFRQIVESKAP